MKITKIVFTMRDKLVVHCNFYFKPLCPLLLRELCKVISFQRWGGHCQSVEPKACPLTPMEESRGLSSNLQTRCSCWGVWVMAAPHSWDGCHQHPSSAPCRGVAKLSHLSVVLSSLHLLPSLLTPPSWAVITPHDASVEIAIGAPSSRHFISIVRKLP